MKALCKRFISNKFVYQSALLALCLLGFHVWQFIDSGYNYQPLLRVVACSLYPIIVFSFGPKSVPWCILFFGLALRQFGDFTHYLEFFCVIVFCCYYEKLTVPAMLAYAIDVIIVCARHEKTAVHLGIHYLTCGFIYLTTMLVRQLDHDKILASFNHYKVPLDLNEDEEAILAELAQGKLQKEIELFSENTIGKKLKNCRIKNDCRTTEELLTRYLAQCDQSHKTVQPEYNFIIK